MELTEGTTSSWASVVKDGRFQSLAANNPIPRPAPGAQNRPATTRGSDNNVGSEGKTIDLATTRRSIAHEKERIRVIISKSNRAAKVAATAPRTGKKGRRGTSSGTTGISPSTRAKDKLGVLSSTACPRGQGAILTQVLRGPPPLVDGNEDRSRVISIAAGLNLSHSSLCLLNQGIWLDDEIIHFLLRAVIEVGCPTSRFISPHFWTSLLITDDGYCYDNVRAWGQGVPGGLLNAENVFFPLNIDNTHWLFLRLRPAIQSIELWDSMGYRSSNGVYLQHLLRYLYDEYASGEMDPTAFGTWAHDWTTEDRSRDSPRQENSYDCGVFSLLTIALLAQGVRVTSSTYSQLDVYRSSTRRRLAFLALFAGRQSDAPHAGRITPFVRRRRPPTAPRPTKHFSHKHDRLIPSKVRVTKHKLKHQYCQKHQSRLLNIKRTPKSIADPTPSIIAWKKLMSTPKRKAARPPSRPRKRACHFVSPPGTNHM